MIPCDQDPRTGCSFHTFSMPLGSSGLAGPCTTPPVSAHIPLESAAFPSNALVREPHTTLSRAPSSLKDKIIRDALRTYVYPRRVHPSSRGRLPAAVHGRMHQRTALEGARRLAVGAARSSVLRLEHRRPPIIFGSAGAEKSHPTRHVTLRGPEGAGSAISLASSNKVWPASRTRGPAVRYAVDWAHREIPGRASQVVWVGQVRWEDRHWQREIDEREKGEAAAD